MYYTTLRSPWLPTFRNARHLSSLRFFSSIHPTSFRLSTTIMSAGLCSTTYRTPPAGLALAAARTIHLFDFDDNVFHMPTRILLFDQHQTPFRVTTGAYAVLKTADNRAMRNLQDYHVCWPDSLLEFADADGGPLPISDSYYARDMCAALGIAGGPAAIERDGPEAVRNRLDPRLLDVHAAHPAKAPLWAEFVHALATDPDNVWIITARLHHPQTIHAALTMLRTLGLLPAVPKPEHIWPVAHPGFPDRFIREFPEHPPLPVLPGDPPLHWSRYKAELLSTLLHRFARETCTGQVTLCKFSDDDHKNVEATLKYLPPVIAQLEGKVAVQVYSTAHVPPPSMAYIDPSGVRDPLLDLPLQVPRPCSATRASWPSASLTINTSNKFKAAEFRTYLLPHVHALDMHAHDLPEPDADPLTIMRYKATHVRPAGAICDDTSLEIPDADAAAAHLVGTNIKWGAHALDELAGKRALFVCMLGRVRVNQETGEEEVAVYRGETWGTICLEDKEASRRLKCSPGFLPWFVPDGGDRPGWSLARYVVEDVDYTRVNPRWIAVQDLLAERAYLVCPTLEKWEGKWQKEDEH